ncbi:hypothetical protein [Flavobacterium sp.]
MKILFTGFSGLIIQLCGWFSFVFELSLIPVNDSCNCINML